MGPVARARSLLLLMDSDFRSRQLNRAVRVYAALHGRRSAMPRDQDLKDAGAAIADTGRQVVDAWNQKRASA